MQVQAARLSGEKRAISITYGEFRLTKAVRRHDTRDGRRFANA
jgi:hypothetical protein